MVDIEFELDHCLDVLQKGGIILYPTDTVWGIGCDATNDDAIKKIYRLKQRHESKTMIMLLPDEKKLTQYTASSVASALEYLKQNPIPTTIIFPHAKNIGSSLIAEDGSMAIRVCRDAFCIRLMEMLGKPLVSTSANISGKTTPLNFQQIEKEILEGVDYVVRHRQDETATTQPSKILSLQADGSLKMIRK